VSPLREIGVDVNNGDFIITVNGTFVNKVNDIYELLVGQAGNLLNSLSTPNLK